MATPFKTLAKIGILPNETVYITNSALCYVNGKDLNPSNVTLTSWGDTRPTIYLTNSGGTALLYMNHAWVTNSFRMVNLKVMADTNYNTIFIYPRAGYGKVVAIENCEFDWSRCTGVTIRVIHLRSPGVRFSFYSNLVHDVTIGSATSGSLISNEGDPYVCDVRYNRFYNFQGLNPGIMATAAANCSGILANNTAWGCNYLMWYNQPGNCLLTNVNNIVEYAKYTVGKNWFRSSSATGRSFCDFTFSGDASGVTFDAFTLQGPSNLTALSEAQIAFWSTNASDMYDPRFLKTDFNSVAAVSDAATMYPELNLVSYAGWAPSIPEPATALLAGLSLLVLSLRKLIY